MLYRRCRAFLWMWRLRRSQFWCKGTNFSVVSPVPAEDNFNDHLLLPLELSLA